MSSGGGIDTNLNLTSAVDSLLNHNARDTEIYLIIYFPTLLHLFTARFCYQRSFYHELLNV